MQRSFLKWPGNKHKLLRAIIELLPKGKRFIDPFAGSGVVFMNVDYPKKIVADRNPDLINLYHTLMKHGETFIEYADTFFVKENKTKERYNAYKDLFNSTKDRNLKAALLLYLNKHGYNGLCRYNLKGGYNVPFDRL
jgi:DNA adenine methylase